MAKQFKVSLTLEFTDIVSAESASAAILAYSDFLRKHVEALPTVALANHPLQKFIIGVGPLEDSVVEFTAADLRKQIKIKKAMEKMDLL